MNFNRSGLLAPGKSISSLVDQLEVYCKSGPGSLAQIDSAIAICRELLSKEQLEEENRLFAQINLGAFLGKKHKITGDNGDLEEAFQAALAATTLACEDEESEFAALFILWRIVVSKYEINQSTGDLKYLIDLGRQVYQDLPPDDTDRLAVGDGLGQDLKEMFDRTKELVFLEEAISVRKTLTSQSSTRILRELLTEKYTQTSALADLDAAILYARKLIDQLESDSVNHDSVQLLDALNGLANLMSNRYTDTNSLSDLEIAIRRSRQAMAVVNSDSERDTLSYNLSAMLWKLYKRRRESQHLNEALRLSETTIGPLSTNHPNRARRLCHHAELLYEYEPSLEILDEAIDYCYKAVQEPQSGYLDRAIARRDLSTFLMTRFHRSSATADLYSAEKYSQEAIDEMEKESLSDAHILNTFATMLAAKYARGKQLEDLDKAIIYARKAVSAEPPSHANRSRNMGNLASHLSERYVRTRDQADIKESLEISDSILATAPEDHVDRLLMLSNHVRYLLQRKEPHDIDEAIEIGRKTFSHETAEILSLSAMRQHLGWAQQEKLKSKSKGDGQAYLTEAINHFSFVAQDEGSQPLTRIQCAEGAAILLTNKPDWLAAYELLSSGVNLLPALGIRGLSWDDRQFLMRELSNTSSLAASLALEAGQSASTALALQETGRGVIATAVINSRSDLFDLKAASPELYEEYKVRRAAVTFQLSQKERDPSDGLTTRSRNLRLIEDLEKRIRETPDLKSFGLPLAPIDLMRLAGLGYIVSFNVSKYRSDAFLVTQTSIENLQLPDLKYADLQNFVQKLPYLTGDSEGSSPEDIPERNKFLRQKLDWLWIVAVSPVLQALKLLHASPEEDHLPRLWWVISGLMGQTPLHAAGNNWGKGVENTASHVMSSYIPTFKMLASSRQASILVQNQKSLGIQVIAMPQTTGFDNRKFSDLSTGKEIDAIRESIKDQDGGVEVLQSPTKTEVISALPSRPIIHFACHGISDSLNPSNSSLLLAKGDLLTVRELADISLPQARVAYLSACSTAQQSSDNLRDEVIHVASAFQLVGFPHVLGTLWEADDGAAVRMAGLFYQELASLTEMDDGERGKFTDGQVALAHFRAVEKLRKGNWGRSIADDVIKWATFVHLGC